jgi:hypothetical protein
MDDRVAIGTDREQIPHGIKFVVGANTGYRKSASEVELAAGHGHNVENVSDRNTALVIEITAGASELDEPGVHFGTPESVLPVRCPESLHVPR